MRVLSANLSRSTAWEPTNLATTVRVLFEAAADVIAVQECPGKEHLSHLAGRLGYQCRIAPSPTGFHTGLLWHPDLVEVVGGDKYADQSIGTWHGFTSSTLTCGSWPSPITFLSAHLIPHDVDTAVSEARFLQTRVRRHGHPGVLLGDLNHLALEGPEPDWATIPEHNRASRTILDQDTPDVLRGDRRVGLVLTRSGLVDAAAHHAHTSGEQGAFAPTGVHGQTRVDQVWVSRVLAEAITGYERLDHRDVTDHHPILVDLALGSLAPIGQVEFH